MPYLPVGCCCWPCWLHLPLDPPSSFGKGSLFLQAYAANLHVIRKSASHGRGAWLLCSAPRPTATARQTISEGTIIRKSSLRLPAAKAPDRRTYGERGRNCHVSIWTIFTVGGNCLGQDGSRPPAPAGAQKNQGRRQGGGRRMERKEGTTPPHPGPAE